MGLRTMKTKSGLAVPSPVKYDSRNCFAVAFFQTETEAQAFSEWVREQGHTYNGGWYHGMKCGRDSSFDRDDPKLGRLYAVTTL